MSVAELHVFKDNKRAIPTFTGGQVDPWYLTPEDIVVEDLAHHLALSNRFTGATDEPYTVAQHSVLCSMLAEPEHKLLCLMHDAAEAYICDLSHPLKYHGPGFLGMAYRELEQRIDRVIEARFGFWPFALADPAIKVADDAVFALEWKSLIDKTESTVTPWTWRRAEMEFLRAYDLYTGAS